MYLVLEELAEPGARTDEVTDALIEALFAHLLGTFEKAPARDETHSRLMGTIREYVARNFREGSMEKMAGETSATSAATSAASYGKAPARPSSSS
jgi:hypothetical protein